MGSKQEKVERCACLQGYDLIVILRSGGMALMSEVLKLKSKGSLGRKNRGDKWCCPLCRPTGVRGALPGHG